MGGRSEAQGDPMNEVIDQRDRGRLAGRQLIGASFGGEFEGGLAHFPSAEAAFSVLAEVLVVNGLAFELGIEDGLDFGE